MTLHGCASERKTRLFRLSSDVKETHGKPMWTQANFVLGELILQQIIEGETGWPHEDEVVPRVDRKRRLTRLLTA